MLTDVRNGAKELTISDYGAPPQATACECSLLSRSNQGRGLLTSFENLTELLHATLRRQFHAHLSAD